ncbi:MAG: hypothetical protein ABJB05_13865 [Parafilimonas sp.]
MKWRIILAKIFVFVAALQILNMSIYAPNVNMLQQKGVITYDNDINSIAEFIGEVVLKHFNAFPEYPNDGHKEMQFSKHIDINAFVCPAFKTPAIAPPHIEYLVPHNEDYNFLFFKEINPPPPKA